MWSPAAEAVAGRIVSAARVVGPTPVEDVPWTLAAGGVWEALLAAGRVPHVVPSEGTWEALEGVNVASGVRAEHVGHWAATRDAVRRAGADGAFDAAENDQEGSDRG